MQVETDTVSLGSFEFECGETISELAVRYEAYGQYTGDNAVLLCHALTGSAHVASHDDGDASSDADDGAGVDDGDDGAGVDDSDDGAGVDDGDASSDADTTTTGQARAWWDEVVGPGKPIDTRRYYVICANVPGSCYGTTGPASTNPATGEPYGTAFPPVTVGDWTRAQRALLDELGVEHLHAVVGGSVGGMNALDWARRYPDRVDRVAPIATGARLDPQCLALDTIARRAIRSDPGWQGGDYYGDGPDPDRGLAIARQLGHVTYLSKDSMDRKFGRQAAGSDADRDTEQKRSVPLDPAGEWFPYREVDSYLDYQAETFVERFDANAYLYLTRAMDDFDLADGFDSDAAALSGFDGEALVVSVTGDWHFTTRQAADLADAFETAGSDAAHHVVDSDHGHDAFLVESDSVGPPLRDFLAAGVAGDAVGNDERDDATAIGDATATARDLPREGAPVHASLFSD